MNKLIGVFSIFLLVLGCSSHSPVKKQDLISKINKEMSSTPTAFGDVGNEKLEVLAINELSSIKLKYPLRDQNGWTILTPSEDSRLMYVSSSTGDDAAAPAYSVAEVDDIFDPSNITAFKTIAAARKLTREGYPDWILLKKGDEWVIDKRLGSLSGRSATEPMVMTSYSSESDQRPLIKTGIVDGFKTTGSLRFFSMIGLEFYAHQRDPNSVDFVGWDNVGDAKGFTSFAGQNNPQSAEAIVLEDNLFNFYAGNIVFTGKGGHKDLVIRRNQILNAYSPSAHAQGLFIYDSNVLLEENLLDHNGWFQQQYEGKGKAEGQATMFNHNAYLVHLKNSVIVKNIISRASSMGIKFTSNSDKTTGINTIESYNILIDNNLIIEGEIGLSLGGNNDFNNGYRWKNINVLNNTFLNIGHSQPTMRTLAWSIEANDWDGGAILGNYILFNDNLDVKNVKGVIVKGLSRNITVDANVMYQINAKDGRHVFLKGEEGLEGVAVSRNYIDYLYDSSSAENISTYMALQGEEQSLHSFIAKVKGLSKGNWDKAYTAERVNEFLKAQFE